MARDGVPVTFRGRLVKRAAPTEADFVTLAPGTTVSGVIELTKHYDMADGGEYVPPLRGLSAPGPQRLSGGPGTTTTRSRLPNRCQLTRY